MVADDQVFSGKVIVKRSILLRGEHFGEVNFKFTLEDIHRNFIIAGMDALKLEFPIFV